INYVASTCSITRMAGRFCNIIYLMVRDMPGAGRWRGRHIPAPGLWGKLLRSEPLHNAGNQLVLDALFQLCIHTAIGLAVFIVEDAGGLIRYVTIKVPKHFRHCVWVTSGCSADGLIGQQFFLRDTTFSFHLTPPSVS